MRRFRGERPYAAGISDAHARDRRHQWLEPLTTDSGCRRALWSEAPLIARHESFAQQRIRAESPSPERYESGPSASRITRSLARMTPGDITKVARHDDAEFAAHARSCSHRYRINLGGDRDADECATPSCLAGARIAPRSRRRAPAHLDHLPAPASINCAGAAAPRGLLPCGLPERWSRHAPRRRSPALPIVSMAFLTCRGVRGGARRVSVREVFDYDYTRSPTIVTRRTRVPRS